MIMAELIANFLLQMMGISIIWVSGILSDDMMTGARLLFIAFGYGMSYGVLVYALSGTGSVRHLNPIITISMWTINKNWKFSALYLFSQFGGGVGALIFVPWIMPERAMQPFDLLENTTPVQALAVSVICSYIVCFIIVTTLFGADAVLEQPVALDNSEQHPQTIHEINSLMSGLTMFVCCFGAAVSGGFLNPITAFCCSFFNGSFAVAPLVGPIIGATLASLSISYELKKAKMGKYGLVFGNERNKPTV